jgi:hypothetical protein
MPEKQCCAAWLGAGSKGAGMSSTISRNRLFEEHRIPTEGDDVLHAELMMPRPPARAQRVVFIAPLVGAGAAQPLVIFRNFTRRGAILVSFEYRGHVRSSGTFELDKTVSDVRHALWWSWNYAQDRGLPLHGFATCFGTVPLLAQFAGHGCGCLLRSISTVSGLFRLDQILRIEDFSRVFSRHLGRALSAAALLAEIARETFDPAGEAFRAALLEYLGGLFPELRVDWDHFEELHYGRVDIPRTLRQLSQARYLDGVQVPPEIPCNFYMGRHDDSLSLHTVEGREAYKRHILSLIPHATLYEGEFDHFGRGIEHDAVIDHLSDLFARFDRATVPAHHLHKIAQLRSVFA